MLKIILLPLALAFSSVSYGACLSDSAEIGDIGPSSELVCDTLNSKLPDSSIVIVDRQIHTPNTVSVITNVDGKTEILKYKLLGADWELTGPVLAEHLP